MSSAAALPLLSSVHPEPHPTSRPTLARVHRVPLAGLGLATPSVRPATARVGTANEIASIEPSPRALAQRPRPVPLTPSVARLHASGGQQPANAISSEGRTQPVDELSADAIPSESARPQSAIHPESATGTEDATSPESATRLDTHSLEHELIAMLPALERRAYRWCHDPAEARDLAQDTVLRALGKKPVFDSQSHLRAWLYTVLRNLFISQRRRDQSWQRAASELSLAHPERTSETSMPFLTASVERALAALPEVFARVVRLVDLEDYSYADAASTLGVPVGTVMSRLFRARQRLARELPAYT